MNWEKLLGKKIVALRGVTTRGKTPLSYILFDDNETFIELSEQDYYSYHDCAYSARHVELNTNVKRWQELFDTYAEPTDLASPF